MTQVYLGGGGSQHDEASLWNEVFTSGQRVSLWPFAMPPGPARSDTVEWFTSVLRARGDFTIDAWGMDSAHDDDSVQRLQGSQVLAIPGGNTFALLHHLHEHDLLSTVQVSLSSGGKVYGGSAGAILLGADIAIAETEDPNDAGVQDTRGLDVLGGAVVWPHYQPSHDAELQQWARQHQQMVLAMPERSGVVVIDATARNVGPDTVQLFTPAGRRSQPAGATWDVDEL